jgi:hypothetical protein
MAARFSSATRLWYADGSVLMEPSMPDGEVSHLTHLFAGP